jgi:putative transposase
LLTNPKGGRPRADDRRCFEAIYYVARTGAQWRSLPRSFGPKSTVHDRYQEWVGQRLFEQLWRQGLQFYDHKTGLNWAWQPMDGSMTKAPLGGEATDPNPTDRGKLGVKRSLLTDGRGIPVTVVVAPANRNDFKLVEKTLDARIVRPPRTIRQRLCLDKGYDYPEVDEVVDASHFEIHTCRRGQAPRRERLTDRARRWGVERTHSWMNRFRRILVRWEKKVENYLGILQLACAWITFQRARLF